jgi:hypothetical protein
MSDETRNKIQNKVAVWRLQYGDLLSADCTNGCGNGISRLVHEQIIQDNGKIKIICIVCTH